jgi:long-subunit fatty acid transport protein
MNKIPGGAMKKLHFILIFTLILVFVGHELTWAQGNIDFNFIGAGARARAMGGAFIGGADDATAASWNPAGLIFLEKPEASATYVYSSVYQSIDNNKVEDLGLSHGYVNFFSAAFPLSIGERNVVGCIAYQRVIDLFDKQETYLLDAQQNQYWYDTKQKGGVDAVSPSVGVQVSPQFSLGLALNIYIGNSVTKWTYWDTDQDVDAPKEKYSGSNLSLGSLFDFGKFRIGAVYKTPYTLKAEREEELNAGGLINFFGYELEMKMPGMLGFGVMVEPTPKLRLAADYELRSFSKFETRTKWTSPDLEYLNSDEFEKAGFENVNQFRLGAEYLLMSGNSFIPLRIGLKSEPKPYKDINGDQVVGGALTMGIGLVSKSYTLGAALEYSALTLKYNYYDGFSYTESDITTSQLNFLLSGIFYFGK